VPADLAREHAFGRRLVHGPDVLAVAAATGRDVEPVARAFSAVGDALRLEWLEGEIEELPIGTRTQRWAQQAARDDVIELRRALAERALREAPGDDVEAAVERFVATRADALERLGRLVRSLGLEEGTDLAGVTLAVRQLRALVR
jgi:glutamate dehydrogenase